MEPSVLNSLARRLHDAARNNHLVAPSDEVATLDHAYAVQEALIALRVAGGERVVGWKMGFTSRAKMRQMGVDAPILAALTDAMRVEDGATVRGLVQPRVEPEVCFLLGSPLEGPCGAAEALRAVVGVCAGLEVLDSRYADFKFDLANVIADNASAAAFVLGPAWLPVGTLDNLGIVLEVNGRVKECASSAAVLDHPAKSLAVLAGMLAARGKRLEAGDIVLTGGATVAVPMAPGDEVCGRIEGLGAVRVRREKEA
ncbi:MAG: 4-oxalocrotonate decarboxylase [Armatimonadetes bacterium]|nr:4-oxalocrotonate decarboxylase [Armatimonadota bacterium]